MSGLPLEENERSGLLLEGMASARLSSSVPSSTTASEFTESTASSVQRMNSLPMETVDYGNGRGMLAPPVNMTDIP